MDRRNFLRTMAAAGASVALPSFVSATAVPAPPGFFDFVFFTDTHIQPELNAAQGCDMAFRRMRTIPVEFAIQGGDHIFDALAVPKARSLSLFDLYDKTQQDLGLKVYHTIGNHDVVGVLPASGMGLSDPLYGKRYFEEHMGNTYQSFDRSGVHFIILDSIGITADRSYEGRVDAAQLAWLANDLKAVPAGKPVIIVSHIPLVTAINQYLPEVKTPPAHNGMTVTNSADVIKLFAGHNVIGVLQGHTHVNERVEWHGVPYLTGGAVCGNWWKGTRLGIPEGFTVVSIRGGKLTTRYETYGFKSVAPDNT